MNWYRRIGFVLISAALIGVAQLASTLFTTLQIAIPLIAPVVFLPLVFRVIVDISAEYDLTRQPLSLSTRHLITYSGIGGLLGGGALYLYVRLTAPAPAILLENLIYIAFVVEWFIAWRIILYQIRAGNNSDPTAQPNTR